MLGRTARLALIMVAVATAMAARGHAPAAPKPKVVLWAWERPEDLRFVPSNVTVAYLARTIYLQGDEAVTRPRLNALRIAPAAVRIAVVRIEARDASLSPRQRHEAAQAILQAAFGAAELQIDFDATASQRDFYRRVIEEVRQGLPRESRLSITALASWCMGDRWLQGMPIDDAVPMFFRMGADRTAGWRAVANLPEPLCRSSIGISTDEPAPPLPHVRRVFVFAPRAWTANELAFVNAQVQR